MWSCRACHCQAGVKPDDKTYNSWGTRVDDVWNSEVFVLQTGLPSGLMHACGRNGHPERAELWYASLGDSDSVGLFGCGLKHLKLVAFSCICESTIQSPLHNVTSCLVPVALRTIDSPQVDEVLLRWHRRGWYQVLFKPSHTYGASHCTVLWISPRQMTSMGFRPARALSCHLWGFCMSKWHHSLQGSNHLQHHYQFLC